MAFAGRVRTTRAHLVAPHRPIYLTTSRTAKLIGFGWEPRALAPDLKSLLYLTRRTPWPYMGCEVRRVRTAPHGAAGSVCPRVLLMTAQHNEHNG
jgi:hypothetical protein